jgi:hypothetical protein
MIVKTFYYLVLKSWLINMMHLTPAAVTAGLHTVRAISALSPLIAGGAVCCVFSKIEKGVAVVGARGVDSPILTLPLKEPIRAKPPEKNPFMQAPVPEG